MTVAGKGLNFDVSLIGRRSEPSVVRILTEQLKAFARATDQRDPAYFDEAAAQQAGYLAIPAPPTFAFSLMLAVPAQAGFALSQLNADPRYILHGEQTFMNHDLLYAEDVVTVSSAIMDMYEKRGGALRFVVQGARLENSAGQLCYEIISKFVLRVPEGAA